MYGPYEGLLALALVAWKAKNHSGKVRVFSQFVGANPDIYQIR